MDADATGAGNVSAVGEVFSRRRTQPTSSATASSTGTPLRWVPSRRMAVKTSSEAAAAAREAPSG